MCQETGSAPSLPPPLTKQLADVYAFYEQLVADLLL